MKIYLVLILLSNLYLNAFAQSGQDKAAVNKAISSFMKSWNNHDFKDIKSYATADFSYITPTATLFKNRNEVENGLQSLHQTMFKNTPLKEESRDIRFITPNVALVTLFDTMGPATGKPGDERQTRTFVLVKQDQKWLLTACHVAAIIANVRPNISNPTK